MSQLAEFTYRTIRDWEGKICKITQKEYTSSVGCGQYYPPEGCVTFQDEDHKDVVYFLGGARHKKPAHWAMSDIMFRVSLTRIEDDKNYTVESFSMINPSTSETSAHPKLAFASGLTVHARNSKLLGFTVNGKCMDVRSREQALTNEIHVYETVHPGYTTYRTTTYRTPERAEKFPLNSRLKEVLQQGEIPQPSYGNTLTSVKSRGMAGTAIMVGGNILSNTQASSIDVMMGRKSIWEEKSLGSLYVLQYDLSTPSFIWEKIPLEISPRANHSAMMSYQFLFIFGGVDYSTNLRHDIRPIVIDITTWSPMFAVVPDNFPDLHISGHGFLKVSEDSCLLVGGYNTLLGTEKDTPTDIFVQMKIDKEAITDVKVIALGCGPIGQPALILTPEDDVFILCGGTQEKWALISKYLAPAVPCYLDQEKKCLLVNTPEVHLKDMVDWLGCDGKCGRWFHAPCLFLSAEQFQDASNRGKWYCNRSDCKK